MRLIIDQPHLLPGPTDNRVIDCHCVELQASTYVGVHVIYTLFHSIPLPELWSWPGIRSLLEQTLNITTSEHGPAERR
ncbi:hypothetical protein V2G26_006542 [Clonostachys chloroleuca]